VNGPNTATENVKQATAYIMHWNTNAHFILYSNMFLKCYPYLVQGNGIITKNSYDANTSIHMDIEKYD
jgi:hypothetical protein